jgi:hypothetical protein
MVATYTVSLRQRGVALFVGLVFLVVLSLVAMIAMKSTLVEMKMVTNAARHEQAFETSEAMRGIPVALFDEHVFQRGWPAELGGDLPDSDFTFQNKFTPEMLTEMNKGLQADCSGETVKTLFYGQLQGACGDYPVEDRFDPATWHPDMIIAVCDVGSDDCAANVAAKISIIPDGQVLPEGAGGAQAAGYRGLGIGSAGGGAKMFFEVRSVGTVPGNGIATTHSQYRQIIH